MQIRGPCLLIEFSGAQQHIEIGRIFDFGLYFAFATKPRIEETAAGEVTRRVNDATILSIAMYKVPARKS